jgi:hypothetical protein
MAATPSHARPQTTVEYLLGDNSAAQKAMRIIIVGVRDNRRVIHWPGIFTLAPVIVALSLLGFFTARQIFDLLGGAPSLLPGVLFAVIMPLGCVLGVQIRRAWRMPLERLPKLS